MNTNQYSNERTDSLSQTAVAERPRRHIAEAFPFPISVETQQLITFGKDRDWREIAILGQGPMIESLARVGDWLLVPAKQDTSQMPARTMARVQALYAAGFRPKDWVIAHEAPLLLAAPPKPKKRWWEDVVKPAAVQASKAIGKASDVAMPVLWKVTKATAQVTWAVTKVAAVTSVVAMGALLAAAVTMDPICIAITDDDTWVEIDRWWV
jgi:hypothetical protein